MKNNRLDSLTSLRFFAAAMVVMSHYKNYLLQVDNLFIAAFAKNVLAEGFIGVTFFFILSGFVISYGYASKIRDRSCSLLDFYVFRAARLMPIHWLLLIAMFPIYWTFLTDPRNGIDTWYRLLSNAFLLQAFNPSDAFVYSFNAVSWSLSVEAFFYLVFPILAFMRTRHLLLLTGTLLVVIVGSLVLLRWSDAGFAHWMFYTNPGFRVLDFLVGILLARWYDGWKGRKLPYATTLEIGALLLLGASVAVGVAVVPEYWRWDLFYIVPMATVIFIFSLMQGRLSKMLQARFWVFLGGASFSLYMVHQAIMENLNKYYELGTFTETMNGLAAVLTLLFVAIGIASLLYRFYEEPLNHLIRRIYTLLRNRFVAKGTALA